MRRAGLAALLAAAGLSFGCGDPTPTTPHAEAVVGLPAAPAGPSVEAAQLGARVSALEARVQQLQSGSADSSAVLPTAAPLCQPTAQHALLEPLPDEHKPVTRATQLQAEFMGEPADPHWASSAQAGIQRALREVGPAGLNAQVECRSRSCRVAVAAVSGDGETWLQQLALQMASSFGTVRTLGADDAGSTVLYLSP